MDTSRVLADRYISNLAEQHSSLVRRDIDALLEVGEVDMETILCGYLWARVQHEFGLCEVDADEGLEEVLTSVIVDFYCDQMDGLYEEEEEDDTSIVADMLREEWQSYTDGEIPLTEELMEDLQDICTKLIAVGHTDAVAEAVHIVADAN